MGKGSQHGQRGRCQERDKLTHGPGLGKQKCRDDSNNNNDNEKPSGLEIKTSSYSDANYKRLTKSERHQVWQLQKDEKEKQKKQWTTDLVTPTTRTTSSISVLATSPTLATQLC